MSARKLPFFQVLESKSSISRLGLSENQGVPILGMTVFRKGVTQKLGFSGKHYKDQINSSTPDDAELVHHLFSYGALGLNVGVKLLF